MISVIAQTGDTEFIKDMIEQRTKYDFSPEELIFLIRRSEDIEFIKQCIDNPQIYGIQDGIDDLIKETKSVPYVTDYVKKKYEQKSRKNEKNKITKRYDYWY